MSAQNDAALDRALMTLDVRFLSCTVPYHYRILPEVSLEQRTDWTLEKKTGRYTIHIGICFTFLFSGVTAILELGLKIKNCYC